MLCLCHVVCAAAQAPASPSSVETPYHLRSRHRHFARIAASPPPPRPCRHLAAAHRPPGALPRRTCSRRHTRPPSRVPRRRRHTHLSLVSAVAPSHLSPPSLRRLATVATSAPPPHPRRHLAAAHRPPGARVLVAHRGPSLRPVRRRRPLRSQTDLGTGYAPHAQGALDDTSPHWKPLETWTAYNHLPCDSWSSEGALPTPLPLPAVRSVSSVATLKSRAHGRLGTPGVQPRRRRSTFR